MLCLLCWLQTCLTQKLLCWVVHECVHLSSPRCCCRTALALLCAKRGNRCFGVAGEGLHMACHLVLCWAGLTALPCLFFHPRCKACKRLVTLCWAGVDAFPCRFFSPCCKACKRVRHALQGCAECAHPGLFFNPCSKTCRAVCSVIPRRIVLL